MGSLAYEEEGSEQEVRLLGTLHLEVPYISNACFGQLIILATVRSAATYTNYRSVQHSSTRRAS